MAQNERTSRKAASAASKVLRKSADKAAKTAAASDLAQRRAKDAVTGKKAATAASATLRKKASPRAAKTAAASDLTQRPDSKMKRRKKG